MTIKDNIQFQNIKPVNSVKSVILYEVFFHGSDQQFDGWVDYLAVSHPFQQQDVGGGSMKSTLH